MLRKPKKKSSSFLYPNGDSNPEATESLVGCHKRTDENNKPTANKSIKPILFVLLVWTCALLYREYQHSQKPGATSILTSSDNIKQNTGVGEKIVDATTKNNNNNNVDGGYFNELYTSLGNFVGSAQQQQTTSDTTRMQTEVLPGTKNSNSNNNNNPVKEQENNNNNNNIGTPNAVVQTTVTAAAAVDTSTTTRNEKNSNHQHQHQQQQQHRAGSSSATTSSNNNNNRNNNNNSTINVHKPIAIVHIGPHKTATTTIQTYMKLYQNEMKHDHYEYPGDWTNPKDTSINMEQLTNCFHYKNFKTSNDCDTRQYNDIHTIGQQKKNIVLTAESFAYFFTNVSQVYETLEPYYSTKYGNGGGIIVVVYYRRFFEWVISYYNMEMRYRLPPKRIPLIDWISDQKRLNGNYMDLYTYGLVPKWKQAFPNAIFKIYNMHNTNHVKPESFFCDAIPNAYKTCATIRKNEKNKTERKANLSTDTLVYGDMAYKAYIKKLYSSDSTYDNTKFDTIDWDKITEKVRYFHEVTNGKKSTDLQPYLCPTKEIVKDLYNKSIYAEQALFPDYYEETKKANTSSLEGTLYQTYIPQNRFCSVDLNYILENDQQWISFFRTIKL